MTSIFAVIMRYIYVLSSVLFVAGLALIGVGAASASVPFLIGGVVAVVVGTLVGFFSNMP
jgi:hypothetical protein